MATPPAQILLADIRAAIASALGASVSVTVGNQTLALTADRISQGFVPEEPDQEFFKDVEKRGPAMNVDWGRQSTWNLWDEKQNTFTGHWPEFEFPVRLWVSFTRNKKTDPTLIEALVEAIEHAWGAMGSGSNPPKSISFTPEVRPDLAPGIVCYTFVLVFVGAYHLTGN